YAVGRHSSCGEERTSDVERSPATAHRQGCHVTGHAAAEGRPGRGADVPGRHAVGRHTSGAVEGASCVESATTHYQGLYVAIQAAAEGGPCAAVPGRYVVGCYVPDAGEVTADVERTATHRHCENLAVGAGRVEAVVPVFVAWGSGHKPGRAVQPAGKLPACWVQSATVARVQVHHAVGVEQLGQRAFRQRG